MRVNDLPDRHVMIKMATVGGAFLFWLWTFQVLASKQSSPAFLSYIVVLEYTTRCLLDQNDSPEKVQRSSRSRQCLYAGNNGMNPYQLSRNRSIFLSSAIYFLYQRYMPDAMSISYALYLPVHACSLLHNANLLTIFQFRRAIASLSTGMIFTGIAPPAFLPASHIASVPPPPPPSNPGRQVLPRVLPDDEELDRLRRRMELKLDSLLVLSWNSSSSAVDNSPPLRYGFSSGFHLAFHGENNRCVKARCVQ